MSVNLALVLPATGDFTLTIKVDPVATMPALTSITAPAAATSSAPTPAWPVNVEKMLARMEKSGRTKSWPHRKVAEHLKATGFTPDAQPDGKAYVRWHIDGTERGLSIYQEGSCLVVDSQPLLAVALTISGAKKSKGTRPRVQWTYGSSVDAALAAATELRAYADKK